MLGSRKIIAFVGTRDPGGAKVAWFKDPDNNLLSITQF